MRLVYKFKTDQHREELTELCRVSKNLYNQALYAIKTSLEKDSKFLFYSDLDRLMKETLNLEGNVNYRLLKAQVAQQTLKVLDKSVKAYIKSVKDWKKNPSKYKGMPKLPKYKGKKGLFQLTYTNQCCKITEDGKIVLAKGLELSIPQFDKYGDKLRNFQQVRVLPKLDGSFEIEIVYLTDDVESVIHRDGTASIDFGVDNLVTLVTDFGNPLIFSGKQVKSKNRFFNKELARLKSEAMVSNKKHSTKRTKALYTRRDNELKDIYHKLSRVIVNYLIYNNVGLLICGQNKGWKGSIHIGKQNNQTFVQIAYDKLIGFLRYKCEMCGIRFVCNEESYTSKCDGLALEEIGKHESYLGKRKKRGLFQSSVGKLINADVNGALNIMRKVVGDSECITRIIDNGWLFQPVKYSNLYNLQVVAVHE